MHIKIIIMRYSKWTVIMTLNESITFKYIYITLYMHKKIYFLFKRVI